MSELFVDAGRPDRRTGLELLVNYFILFVLFISLIQENSSKVQRVLAVAMLLVARLSSV